MRGVQQQASKQAKKKSAPTTKTQHQHYQHCKYFYPVNGQIINRYYATQQCSLPLATSHV
jgi:hypothetical protein